MLIARELRKLNIAEYILYMWQVEDSLRACAFDTYIIEKQLVDRFKVEGDGRNELIAWYSNLAVMMEKEHVQEKGHLQVMVNLVNDLNEFHLKMLEVRKDPEYVRLSLENKGAIDELTQKAGSVNDMATCLNALYGFMLLKLKSSEISPATQSTIENIARQVGHLSARYIQFENDDFEF
jgi:hypothetical protein